MNLLYGLQELGKKGIFFYNLDLNNIYVNSSEKEPTFILSPGLFDRAPGELKTCESLRYASPEELNGKGRQSTTWVWVIGIWLYEFVYGRHPFLHKDASVMRALIERYPPPFPENVKVSYDLKLLIYDLLSKDWGQRIGSER